MSDAGAIALAETLRSPNHQFTSLDLRYHQIGDVAARGFVKALRAKNPLAPVDIDLNGNLISSAVCAELKAVASEL